MTVLKAKSPNKYLCQQLR